MASFLGITSSRYQWVLDNATEEDMLAAEEDLHQVRLERELSKQAHTHTHTHTQGGSGLLVVEEVVEREKEQEKGKEEGGGNRERALEEGQM